MHFMPTTEIMNAVGSDINNIVRLQDDKNMLVINTISRLISK